VTKSGQKIGMFVNFKCLGGTVPKWGNLTDAGLDLHASVDITLPPKVTRLVPLGIASEFTPTLVAIIKDRSGLASKGIYTHGGVIDSSYRGEWKVILRNTTDGSFVIRRGNRIAQVLFVPCFHPLITTVEKLSESQRGGDGFGSSGC
jgi:dUTP pyrophosphatase